VGFVRGLFVFPSNQPRKSTINYEQTTNKPKTLVELDPNLIGRKMMGFYDFYCNTFFRNDV
jgi:hypothetical protein